MHEEKLRFSYKEIMLETVQLIFVYSYFTVAAILYYTYSILGESTGTGFKASIKFDKYT